MIDVHSCSLYCDRSACIKAQRDQLRDDIEARKFEGLYAEPEPEPVAWMFVHNRGGGQKGYTFHTLEEYPLAYRDTCLETIPLYTRPAPQSAP